MSTPSSIVEFSQEKLYFLLPLSLSSIPENVFTIQNKLQLQKEAIVYKVVSKQQHRYMVSAPVGIIEPGSSVELRVTLEKGCIEASLPAAENAGPEDGHKSIILNKDTKDELMFFFSVVQEGKPIRTVEEASAFWKTQKSLLSKGSFLRGSSKQSDGTVDNHSGTTSEASRKEDMSGSKSTSLPYIEIQKNTYLFRLRCVFAPREEIPPSVNVFSRSIKESPGGGSSSLKSKRNSAGEEKGRLGRSVRVQTPQEEAAAAARIQWAVKKEKKKRGIKYWLSVKVPKWVAILFLVLAFVAGIKETDTALSRRIAGH